MRGVKGSVLLLCHNALDLAGMDVCKGGLALLLGLDLCYG